MKVIVSVHAVTIGSVTTETRWIGAEKFRAYFDLLVIRYGNEPRIRSIMARCSRSSCV